ncbi:helix-turn-helix transcriptional regulator [Sphingomonas sp. HF-S3]|uniref:Helix-turn-helix transcriptional regulator n=1 Tax=Sphingomonas rustica TaxID=3103142 RepID=A0ABV0B290_9SPHN
MITAIREVRRARGLTLDDVARRCVPPTTAQTIGRLETGTRTVSVGWLNRIAKALGVEASDLVRVADRPEIPVAAVLDGGGAQAPRRDAMLTPVRAEPGTVAVSVAGGIGDYRTGDEIWCRRLDPDDFAAALNRDVLVPRPGGRFLFGRLIGREPGDRTPDGTGRLHLLPLGAGARQQVVADPAWIGCAVRLVRPL